MKTVKAGILAAAGMLLLSGCATDLLKSTPFDEAGNDSPARDASSRVNLWPLAYWNDPVGSVLWPLVSFSDDHLALRPVYSQHRQGGAVGAWDEFNLFWPIAQADTRHGNYRLFPLFWGTDRQDRAYFNAFPLFWHGADHNALLPFWYYGHGADSWTFHTLAGLAGARRTSSGYRCSWAAPLWYEDNEGLFATPLYGQTKDSHWVFPLWFEGERAFVTPLYAAGVDDDSSWWAVPLFFSWGRTSLWKFDKKRSFLCSEGALLLGLVGWEAMDGLLESLYVFPLLYWEDGGTWMTWLGGQKRSGLDSYTFLTPFMGVIRGTETGGWLLPLWSNSTRLDFDEKVGLIDSPTLPACVKVSEESIQDDDSSRTCLVGSRFWTRRETMVLLHDVDRTVEGATGSADGTYEITSRTKRGNALLVNDDIRRRVVFDLKTREKVSDREERASSLLLWLYQYDGKTDLMTGESETRHRVLWRLWDWRGKGGSVSLDAFPALTYDRRRDGSTKLSFLWRLFRYEREQDASLKIDLLFLPIWR